MASPVGSSTSAEPRSGSFRISTNGSSIRPSAFQKVSRHAQFLDRPAQEMGLGQDEGQLGKLRRLEAEEAQVEPPPRPKPHRAEEQHRDQQQDRDPVGDHGPARQGVVIHAAQTAAAAPIPSDIPDDLPEPALVVPGRRARPIR